MTVKKNKSEIAESFKNLLQKADEMALEKKKDDIIHKSHLLTEKSVSLKMLEPNVGTFDRLGIKSIKRIPENPFTSKSNNKSEIYLKKRKELIIKLSIILNKHIHYWLQKEMPKFAREQLKKHISGLLSNLQK